MASIIVDISSLTAFIFGLLINCILYFFKAPSIMLGLGVYLHFYMSSTTFIGGLVRLLYNFICKLRLKNLSLEEVIKHQEQQKETSVVVSSGLLGGKPIAEVVITFVSIFQLTATG